MPLLGPPLLLRATETVRLQCEFFSGEDALDFVRRLDAINLIATSSLDEALVTETFVLCAGVAFTKRAREHQPACSRHLSSRLVNGCF